MFKTELKSDDNKILMVIKDQNDTTSETLKNCDVKDNMNWSCTLEEVFLSSKHIMKSGKYFSSLSYRMLDGKDDKRFNCAED